VAALAAVVLLAAVAIIAIGREQPPLPRDEAASLAASLARGHGPSRAATAAIEAFRRGAGVTSSTVRVVEVRRRGRSHADATLSFRHALRGFAGTWTYTSAATFVRRDGAWAVQWSPAVVHPLLRAGDAVVRTRTRPPRGRVLAADGTSDAVPTVTLGRVGPATAAEVARLGAAYEAGDTVGQTALQQTFEPVLAGTPSGTIAFDGTAGSGRHVVVHRIAGRPGADVRTTIRPELQHAAEQALAPVTQPSALVAIDAATGGIVAVANGPAGSGFDRALAGRYPPGSTFKVITAEALLTDGLTPDSSVDCEPTATVGGKRFRNFEGEAFGAQPLREAFAHSCNTAFVTEAGKLTNGQLVAAAERFGFDTPYKTGVAASHASFPTPRDTAERAAAAIGQGRVLVTPVHMASVAAAVADGTWRAPHLGLGVPPAAVATAHPTAAALDPLRSMMRSVVTIGTGTAAAGIPDLAGKTGTAEFGRGDPLPTHAWFIGFRHGVGFAVVVEGGGVGGRVAAPVAARFARAL
jgi:cell division protein FtsI/penicillin-binding protein 2